MQHTTETIQTILEAYKVLSVKSLDTYHIAAEVTSEAWPKWKKPQYIILATFGKKTLPYRELYFDMEEVNKAIKK